MKSFKYYLNSRGEAFLFSRASFVITPIVSITKFRRGKRKSALTETLWSKEKNENTCSNNTQITFLANFSLYNNNKCQDILQEFLKLWNMRVKIVPMIINSIGTNLKTHANKLEEFNIVGRIKIKTVKTLLKFTWILLRVIILFAEMTTKCFCYKDAQNNL